MLHIVFQFVPECAVLLIDIELIPLEGIIGYKNIRITIIIYIADCHPQAKADQCAMDPCLFGDFGKMVIVIAEQVITL